ncbi:MAG TPA: NADP-dependent oxidoreductase [Dongiaceae bacterium]|jgi:NADPH-dependent curcumin reductase CurA
MSDRNKQVLLAAHPEGWVKETDFKVVDAPMPSPGAGQVLVRNHYLSLDPYMRGRISQRKSYAKGVEVGQVMVGGTVGEVIASNDPAFAIGDKVLGYQGWQLYGVAEGKSLQKLNAAKLPLSVYLGAAGMPGVTAWIGLLQIAKPKAGETVAVAAATGAVGAVVGQLAKLQGCRAIGIAGGAQKCSYAVKELGFDACIDHRGNLAKDLEAATPQGIDIYFENVGGEVLQAVLPRLNDFSRIPLCGLISDYNATEPRGIPDLRMFLFKRIHLQGFICSDTPDVWPEAIRQLEGWIAAGKIKYREMIVDGLENAPRAFIGLFKGENFGKLVVKLR